MPSHKFFAPITIALLSSVICLETILQSAVAKTPPSASIIAQATDNNNANNLDGTWDFQVSLPQSQCSVQGACVIKIVGNIGRYVMPSPNGGAFQVSLFPTSTNRGKPLVTIAAFGVTGTEVTYAIVYSGRLDQPGFITGRFVDVDDNQGTFTLKKQP